MTRKRKYSTAKNHRLKSNGENTDFIGFRVPRSLKRDFRLLCVVRNVPMSDLFRTFMRNTLTSQVTHF